MATIGGKVAGWIEAHCCHGPGDKQGERPVIDGEMLDFLNDAYRLDDSGRRLYDECVLSRPKGRAKTEVAGWIGCAEAFSDVVRCDGFEADGSPLLRGVTSPLLKCLATEEEQATGTFAVIAYVMTWGQRRGDPVFEGATGVRVYQSATSIYLQSGGEVRACSSGAASKDGGKETWVVCDESHLYVLPALKQMYATVHRNLGKRKAAQPWMMQTTTQYRVGEQSIAEQTLSAWRKGDLGPEVHVDHREAEGAIRVRDREHTMAQLAQVYGEAAEWMDLDGVYRKMTDPRICPDEATAARYYLNRAVASSDAWIPLDVVRRQARVGDVVEFGEPITLGFDGSWNDDTTVLRGCRMSDGFLFTVGMWPKPEGAAGVGWEVPRREVLDKAREAFGLYEVVAMYADPHEWRSDVDSLAEEFKVEERVRGRVVRRDRVVSWETRRDTAMAYALDRLHADLVNGEVWHDGDPRAVEHYGNAYTRFRGQLRLVRKEYPKSPRKIDTVVGDALAYEARADAIAAGWDRPRGGLTRVKGRASGR